VYFFSWWELYINIGDHLCRQIDVDHFVLYQFIFQFLQGILGPLCPLPVAGLSHWFLKMSPYTFL
jgi:hypothetical protein